MGGNGLCVLNRNLQLIIYNLPFTIFFYRIRHITLAIGATSLKCSLSVYTVRMA
jgi:hypothetical protein